METGGGSLTEQLIVTDRGREALSLFGTRLPGDVSARILAAAPEFHGRMVRNQQVRAAYEIARPNDYRINLSVHEWNRSKGGLTEAPDWFTLETTVGFHRNQY